MPFVCLSVCLLVTLRKTTELIFMKICHKCNLKQGIAR